MSFKAIEVHKTLLEKEISRAATVALSRLGDKAKQLDWFAGNSDQSGQVKRDCAKAA